MSDTNERKLLARLLKQMDKPCPLFLTSRWFFIVVWLVLILIFVLLFMAVEAYQIRPVWLAAGSAVVGLLTACVLMYAASVRQWSYIHKHMSKQSIRDRLSELGER